jgi:hypothetical protein
MAVLSCEQRAGLRTAVRAAALAARRHLGVTL